MSAESFSWFSWMALSKRVASMVQFVSPIYAALSDGWSWFTSTKTESPPPNTVIQRAWTPKSWFDVLSAQWVERPLVSQIFIFASVAVFVHLVFGVFATLAVVMLMIGIHAGFVSHNAQRKHHANDIVNDVVLEATSQKAHEEIHQQVQAFLNKELEAAQASSDTIQAQTHKMAQTSKALATEQKDVIQVLAATHSQVTAFDSALDHAAQQAARFSAASMDFARVVDDVALAQKALDAPIHSLTSFVETLKQTDTRMDEAVASHTLRLEAYSAATSLRAQSLQAQEGRLHMAEQKRTQSLLSVSRARLNGASIDSVVPRPFKPVELFEVDDDLVPEDLLHDMDAYLHIEAEERARFDGVLRLQQEELDEEARALSVFIEANKKRSSGKHVLGRDDYKSDSAVIDEDAHDTRRILLIKNDENGFGPYVETEDQKRALNQIIHPDEALLYEGGLQLSQAKDLLSGVKARMNARAKECLQRVEPPPSGITSIGFYSRVSRSLRGGLLDTEPCLLRH